MLERWRVRGGDLRSPSSLVTRSEPWWRDGVLWGAALIIVCVHAWVFLSSPYLPYIDWSNHVGLAGVLAHGDTSGADAFFERSFAPTPYWLFYAGTALLGQWMAVPWAAQLMLVCTSLGLAVTGPMLAAALGRHPRQGFVAPFVLFGFALGYGFAAFLVGLPFLLLALALHERVIQSAAEGPLRRAQVAGFGASLLLLYLSHAMLALVGALLLVGRAGLVVLVGRRKRSFDAWGYVRAVGLAALPALLFALPWLYEVLARPIPEAGAPADAPWLTFKRGLAAQLGNWRGHLLDRGDPRHLYTMAGLALLWCVLVGGHLSGPRRRMPRPPSRLAYVALAVPLLALYLAGPTAIAFPVGVWLVYERFGTLAAFFLFLAPSPRLSGRAGLGFVALLLGAYGGDAMVHHQNLERFSGWAAPYDAVRAFVPPGARVLALTEPVAGDVVLRHPSLRTLHFYHLADGTAYGAYCFNHPVLPVRYRGEDQRPPAPPAAAPLRFDPRRHGAHFDYWVFRGPNLRALAERGGTQVFESGGWAVYRPRPIMSGTVDGAPRSR